LEPEEFFDIPGKYNIPLTFQIELA
jgi:hypothetical protein